MPVAAGFNDAKDSLQEGPRKAILPLASLEIGRWRQTSILMFTLLRTHCCRRDSDSGCAKWFVMDLSSGNVTEMVAALDRDGYTDVKPMQSTRSCSVLLSVDPPTR